MASFCPIASGEGRFLAQASTAAKRRALIEVDLVSARRMEVNTFFLVVNTALLAVFASLVKEKMLSRWPEAEVGD